MAQVNQKLAAESSRQRTELNNKVNQKVKATVEELKPLLEITDTVAKTKELAKLFSDNVEAIVKKKGDQRKADLKKSVGIRIAAIVSKADVNKDGKIDFEGKTVYRMLMLNIIFKNNFNIHKCTLVPEFKALALNKDTEDFFDEQLDLSNL